MKYSSTKPTEPGLYWYRNGFYSDMPVVVTRTSSSLYVRMCKRDGREGNIAGFSGEWAGPLEPPKCLSVPAESCSHRETTERGHICKPYELLVDLSNEIENRVSRIESELAAMRPFARVEAPPVGLRVETKPPIPPEFNAFGDLEYPVTGPGTDQLHCHGINAEDC